MQDFSVARRAMVDSQLRPQAVTDAAVLDAMGAVPREQYVPDGARDFAYVDRSVMLDGGRRLMPPAAIGRLLSELAPRPGERALLVAPAGGYARALLEAIGLTVDSVDGPGIGTAAGPYDLILFDGAVDRFPPAFAALLGSVGRIGGAISTSSVSRIMIGQVAGGSLGLRPIVDADIAPIAAFERPQAFSF